jgi:CubicO group peptidase (beta-lactamase class C family)
MSHSLHRRELVAALAAPLLVPGLARRASRASKAIEPPSDAFVKDLPRQLEIAGVPAIGLSVVRDRRVVWQHIEGVADASTGQPAGASSLWPAASLSKPVVALAALRLADDGALDLDRPLKSYVPDHAPADARGDRITARHVLSHSSGLRNWRGRPDQPLVPDFEPGARFQYSGEGYYYLQRVLEHVTGTGFGQVMEQRVFAPLGMASSTFTWRADTASRVVTGHDHGQPTPNFSKDLALKLLQAAEREGKPLASFTHEQVYAAMQAMTPPPAPALLPNFMLPNAAGGLLTTPADYAAFLSEALGGGVPAADLKPATRAAMLAPQVRINSALAWGLGWGLERQGGEDYAWHWGDNGSWKNFVLAHPASRSAIVLFTNGSRGLNVARSVIQAATGEDQAAFLWI